MPNHRTLAALIAGLTAASALALLAYRGGLIAGAALLLSVALLAKSRYRPAQQDLPLSIGLAALAVLAWMGTHQYVISTWESGEVVELVIDTAAGPHVARLWVLDLEEDPVVYYDAPPEVAQALLSGTPVQLTRNGSISTRVPEAVRVDDVTDERGARILEAMTVKYGDRNDAATLYYLLLGSPGDRIELLAALRSG